MTRLVERITTYAYDYHKKRGNLLYNLEVSPVDIYNKAGDTIWINFT